MDTFKLYRDCWLIFLWFDDFRTNGVGSTIASDEANGMTNNKIAFAPGYLIKMCISIRVNWLLRVIHVAKGMK